MSTITTMSAQEFESFIIQNKDNEQINLQPAFAQSLTQSIQQAKTGDATSLTSFRQQLAHE